MAPTAPQKRPSMRSNTSKSTPSSSVTTPSSGSGLISRPSFLSSSTKKDKRVIKSSAFKSRIEKSHSKPLKRRHPSKKLSTTLNSLADALPDLEEMNEGRGRKAEGGKIKMDSLTSGKGLMKRREKVERRERERFARNLAVVLGSQVPPAQSANTGTTGQVQGAGEGVKAPSATAKRFQALRAWIGETMEKDGAFEGKK